VPGSAANAKLQGRVETVIRVLAPLLDLVIAAGDRASRVLDRGERQELARLPHEGELAPRGLGTVRRVSDPRRQHRAD
jgi:hypothetical protein